MITGVFLGGNHIAAGLRQVGGRRGLDGGQFFKLAFHRRARRQNLHAHVFRHSIAGGVEGGESAAQIPSPEIIGIQRAAQQIHDHAHLGLGQRNHIGSGGVFGLAGLEFLRRLANLNPLIQQDIQQAPQRALIKLIGRDQEGLFLAVRASLGLAQSLLGHIKQDLRTVFGHSVQHCVGRAILALDDIAQPPPAAGPGMGEMNLLAIEGGGFIVVALQLLGMNVEGGGQLGVGAFAEHTGDVVAVGNPVVAIVPPTGELRHHRSAGQPFLLHAIAHICAVKRQLVVNQRVGMRPHRVFIRRHKDAGAIAAHMVVVKIRLRRPLFEEDIAHILGFHDIVGKSVPVVVVAGVFVVKGRVVAALVGGVQCGVIPVGHHNLAVRVEAGNHHQHDVFQDILNLLAVAGQ